MVRRSAGRGNREKADEERQHIGGGGAHPDVVGRGEGELVAVPGGDVRGVARPALRDRQDLLEYRERERGPQDQDDHDDGGEQRQRDRAEALPGVGPVHGRRLVELARNTLQGGMDDQHCERQRAPDVGNRNRIERGIGISGPVHRVIDQPQGEQDAVEETELKAVHERPDEAVGDRRHAIGNEDQQPGEARGPQTGPVEQERDADREHDFDHHHQHREQDGVLEREREQRILEQAGVVLPIVPREHAAPQLRDANLVQRKVARVRDRIGEHQQQQADRRQVHRHAERVG
jgi:hypothetical protein